MAIIAVLIVALFALYLLYGFSLVIQVFFMLIKESVRSAFVLKTSPDSLQGFEKNLAGRFTFYDRLPEKLKAKFLMRVRRFVAGKTFEGREGLEVTEEMKTWVAASAVQLTFGLDSYLLNHFKKIILYPQEFYNSRNDAIHIGETNTRGVIVLSWNDLLNGYSNPSDNFNVGLHEMAHALELQLLLKDDYDFFFGNYYYKWSLITEEEFRNIESERASYLRQYAGSNKREFFAVCIEYFFESPGDFRQKLPEIYYHLSILLNQDPLHDDGHVEELPRKTPEELMLEISTRQPVLVPEYGSFDFIIHILYFGFIFSMLLIQGFKGTYELLYISVVVAVIALLSLFYRMNRVVLYENCLVIKSPFGKIKDIFELDDIMAVKRQSERIGDSIEILRARQGRIIRSSFGYIARGRDMSMLLEKLREKKIATT